MFFPKRVKGLASRKHKVTLNLDFNKRKGGFLKQKNVARVGNSLLSTFGLENKFPSSDYTRVVYYHGGYLAIMTEERGLYLYFGTRQFRRFLTTSNCIIGYVEFDNDAIVSSVIGTYTTTNGFNGTLLTWDHYPSLAVCYGRIFGVNGTTLCITPAGAKDSSMWSQSSKITSPTELNAVVALDKVYALGDTCYALSPDAQDIDMHFAPICYGIGKVQTETVATIGNRAFFASTKGLYQVKSNEVKPVFTELNDFVSFDGCVACAYQGKYYVTCKRKDGDMTQNDILLVLDVDSETIYAVFDVCAQHVNTLAGTLYIVINNEVYTVCKDDTESCYGETVDFNCTDVKYLDKLAIKTRSDVDVWIKGNGEKRRYRIKGKNSIQSIPVTGSGRQFEVEIEAHNGMQLDMVELTARSYEV